MKKIIALVFAMLMVMAMAACDDGAAQPYIPPVAGGNSGTNSGSANGTEPSGAVQDVAVELTFGEYDGDRYSNRFLGLTYTLPDGFTFATLDEVREDNDIQSSLSEDEANAALREKEDPLLMRATDENGLGIVIGVIKKNAKEHTESASAYLDYMEQEARGDSGSDVTGINIERDVIDGRASAMHASANVEGESRYITYVVYEVRDYLALAIIRTTSETTLEAILDGIAL